VLAVVCNWACSEKTSSPGESMGEAGALRVALRYDDLSGTIYHLRDSQFQITGEEELLLEGDDSSLMETDLVAGEYGVLLRDGWWMEKESDGNLEEVEAKLLTPNPSTVEIVGGETTDFTLRFEVEGKVLTIGKLRVDIEVSQAEMGDPPDASIPSVISTVVINEVDYDQAGSDSGEFVEIYNPTASDVDTEGLSLELINGADGTAQVYTTIDLSSAGDILPAGGYLVVGDSEVLANLPEDVLSVELSGSIQNGDPDGLRLLDGGIVVDSVSYGGNIEDVTEGNSAPADTEEGSVARCGNGEDSDNNDADFAVTDTATPGLTNSCPF
jgi:hypothetical protein